MSYDWLPIQCLAAILVAATYLYLWTRPVLTYRYDPVTNVVSIRRRGARVWRSYAGMAGDILFDVEPSGAIVGITMTEMQRYHADPKSIDAHPDRAKFPSYLWRALRKWIQDDAKSQRVTDQILSASRKP